MWQGALCAWSVAAAHASDIRARLCVGDCCIAVREAATQSRPVTSTSVTPRHHERLLRGGGSVQSIGGPSGQVCTAVLDSEQLSQHRLRVDRDDVDVESTLAVPAIHVVVEHFGNVPGPLREERLGRVCTSTAESGTTD